LKSRHDKGKAFFLLVHYFDPHSPYLPPEPYKTEFLKKSNAKTALEKKVARYDGEIAYTDHEIGRLLKTIKSLGVDQNTLIVLVSDHGEGFMEHNHLEHGANMVETRGTGGSCTYGLGAGRHTIRGCSGFLREKPIS
jgi:arylsulfatase A-like enzyme